MAQSKTRQQHGLEKPNVQGGNKGQNGDETWDQESPRSLLNTMIRERSGRASWGRLFQELFLELVGTGSAFTELYGFVGVSQLAFSKFIHYPWPFSLA